MIPQDENELKAKLGGEILDRVGHHIMREMPPYLPCTQAGRPLRGQARLFDNCFLTESIVKKSSLTLLAGVPSLAVSLASYRELFPKFNKYPFTHKQLKSKGAPPAGLGDFLLPFFRLFLSKRH